VSADPNHPDARVQTSQSLGGGGAPVALTTVSALAHYGTDRKSVNSDSAVNSIDVAGGPTASSAALGFRRQATLLSKGPLAAAAVKPTAADNSAIHVDSAVAHTKQTYDTEGALLVTADAALKGVSLAGGMVHIDSITATSTSRNDGQAITSHEEHLTLGGVTAGGSPAAIDETGVHLASNSVGAGPLNDALAAALGQAGISIKVLSSEGSVVPGDPKTVKSQVQGVLFHAEQYLAIPNATDTYFTTVSLGSAATVATATSERGSLPPAEEGGIGGVDQGTAAIPGTPGTPASFDPGTPGTPSTPSVATNTRTRRPTTVLGNRSVLGQLEADLVGALISHRFEILYLSFTLAFIGVCLSSRLLVPRARQVS
jgi:hypothetical protein